MRATIKRSNFRHFDFGLNNGARLSQKKKSSEHHYCSIATLKLLFCMCLVHWFWSHLVLPFFSFHAKKKAFFGCERRTRELPKNETPQTNNGAPMPWHVASIWFSRVGPGQISEDCSHGEPRKDAFYDIGVARLFSQKQNLSVTGLLSPKSSETGRGFFFGDFSSVCFWEHT